MTQSADNPFSPPPAVGYGAAPAYSPAYSPATYGGPGKIRGTGICILLTVVTFGIYPFVYYYGVHDEMKRAKGSGLGGGLALVIALFAGFAMPYLTSSEVGELYERRGLPRPVSGLTGLWYFPGIFLFGIGPIVWFVKTNGALNNYWRGCGLR